MQNSILYHEKIDPFYQFHYITVNPFLNNTVVKEQDTL